VERRRRFPAGFPRSSSVTDETPRDPSPRPAPGKEGLHESRGSTGSKEDSLRGAAPTHDRGRGRSSTPRRRHRGERPEPRPARKAEDRKAKTAYPRSARKGQPPCERSYKEERRIRKQRRDAVQTTQSDGRGLERLLESPGELKGWFRRQDVGNERLHALSARSRDLVSAGNASIHWT